MPTQTTTVSALDVGLAALEHSRRALLAYAEDIPDSKLVHRSHPKGNHACWILGHLAGAEDFFLSQASGKPQALPESWNRLFGHQTEPVDDASRYPKRAEILQKLHETRKRLIDWMGSLSDEQLAAPMPDELKAFAPNVAGMMASLAWHEGFHAGQIVEIRRSLGMPRKFG